MFHHTGGSGDCQRFPGEKTAKNQFFRGFADIGGVWARMAKKGGVPRGGRNLIRLRTTSESTFPKGEGKITQPPAAAPKPPKDPVRRLCRGLRPQRGQFKQSSATRAAPNAAAFPTAWNPDGGPGGIAALAIPPGGFAPLSTRESGHLLAAPCSNKRKDNLIIPHAGEFHPFNKLWGISVCTLRSLSVSVVYRISTWSFSTIRRTTSSRPTSTTSDRARVSAV